MEIDESYASFCHGDLIRLSVYDDKLPDYIIKDRDDNLKKLTSSLPENAVKEAESLNVQVKEMQQNQISTTDENGLSVPTEKKQEGCYIATAVYGHQKCGYFANSVIVSYSLTSLAGYSSKFITQSVRQLLNTLEIISCLFHYVGNLSTS